TLGGLPISGLTYTVTAVSGTGNTQFDIGFAAQTAVGTYAMTIGPSITDVAGNAMNQNGNAVNGETPGDQFTATGTISSTTTTTFSSVDVPKNIADVATTTSVLNVGSSLTISKITVKLNINHTWDSDLRISLKAPNGTTRILVNRRGGSGDNFTKTIFADAATQSVVNCAAPFANTYRPEQTLSAFNGLNASGTWSLIVQDLAAQDVGKINAWSITITSTGGLSVEEPGAPLTPNPVAPKFEPLPLFGTTVA